MKIKIDLIKTGFLLIVLMLIYYVTSYMRVHALELAMRGLNYAILYDVWTGIWTSILSVLFFWEHLCTWRVPGKWKINYIKLILSLLMLTMYLPRSPLIVFYDINRIDVLMFVFWYALIHTFYKEKQDLKTEEMEEQPLPCKE